MKKQKNINEQCVLISLFYLKIDLTKLYSPRVDDIWETIPNTDIVIQVDFNTDNNYDNFERFEIRSNTRLSYKVLYGINIRNNNGTKLLPMRLQETLQTTHF